MSGPSACVVNHHADHPAFAGPAGLFAAFVMLVMGRGRGRLAADAASVSDSDRVVDVGCGAGSAVRAAAARGAEVIGVDPAPVMLRLARVFTRVQPPPTWLEGTAEDLPLPDGSATVVWSIATVHHWKNVPTGLAEAHRVLAPGGRLLAIERRVQPGATGLASHGWTEPQAKSFAGMCAAAGFQSVRIDRRGRRRHASWVVHAVR